MNSSPSPRQARRPALFGLTAVLLTGAACTFVLDRSTAECQVDSDCLKFGVHPHCQDGACMDTMLACFAGVPADETTLLTACSAASCTVYDDCAQLGLCGDAGLPATFPPDAGAAAAAGSDAGPPNYPNCTDLAHGEFVPVMTGSSNFPSLLDNMAKLIATGAAELPPGPPFIWQITSSCTSAAALWSSDPTQHYIHDPVPGSDVSLYAAYYDSQGNKTPCLVGNDPGLMVTLGESDVYSTTCDSTFTLNADIQEKVGPVQAMAFVVTEASNAQAISQNAAHEIFGCGGCGANTVSTFPWTNPNRYFIRSKSTGTQQMIAKEIGVAPDKFWGIDQHTANNVVAALFGLSGDTANEAIGLLSAAVYDQSRGQLKELAYRRTDQDCAYLPDSTLDSKDKANVRDGHYPIWGPLHFFYSGKEATGEPSGQAAGPTLQLSGFFLGQAVNQLVIDQFISAGLIPNCAMTVTRQANVELAPLSPAPPSQSCGCYFVAQANGIDNPPGCTPCRTASNCPADHPVCNFGFCEVN